MRGSIVLDSVSLVKRFLAGLGTRHRPGPCLPIVRFGVGRWFPSTHVPSTHGRPWATLGRLCSLTVSPRLMAFMDWARTRTARSLSVPTRFPWKARALSYSTPATNFLSLLITTHDLVETVPASTTSGDGSKVVRLVLGPTPATLHVPGKRGDGVALNELLAGVLKIRPDSHLDVPFHWSQAGIYSARHLIIAIIRGQAGDAA